MEWSLYRLPTASKFHEISYGAEANPRDLIEVENGNAIEQVISAWSHCLHFTQLHSFIKWNFEENINRDVY